MDLPIAMYIRGAKSSLRCPVAEAPIAACAGRRGPYLNSLVFVYYIMYCFIFKTNKNLPSYYF